MSSPHTGGDVPVGAKAVLPLDGDCTAEGWHVTYLSAMGEVCSVAFGTVFSPPGQPLQEDTVPLLGLDVFMSGHAIQNGCRHLPMAGGGSQPPGLHRDELSDAGSLKIYLSC